MPIYIYEVIREETADGLPGCCFEVVQAIHDAALTQHPVTGQPVRRVIQAVGMTGAWSDAGVKQNLDDTNLARHGFAKYIKVDEGTYERMAGDGPKRLSAKPPEGEGG